MNIAKHGRVAASGKRALTWSLLTGLLLATSACGLRKEIEAVNEGKKLPKVWIFVELNVTHGDKSTSGYYYYGRISQALYDKMTKNDITRGFLTLEEVRYYGKDDKVYAYADDDSTGDLVFRIEDIKRIERLKQPPRLTVNDKAKADSSKVDESKSNAESNATGRQSDAPKSN